MLKKVIFIGIKYTINPTNITFVYKHLRNEQTTRELEKKYINSSLAITNSRFNESLHNK